MVPRSTPLAASAEKTASAAPANLHLVLGHRPREARVVEEADGLEPIELLPHGLRLESARSRREPSSPRSRTHRQEPQARFSRAGARARENAGARPIPSFSRPRPRSSHALALLARRRLLVGHDEVRDDSIGVSSPGPRTRSG